MPLHSAVGHLRCPIIRLRCDSHCEHHRSRNGSSGDVNVYLSSLLPGMPGTTRSDSGTRHKTVAVTVAGTPTPTVLNWVVSTCTTGLQFRPSRLSAARALDSAAACAAPGVREIDACRAAARAAASTDPWAIEVRPAAIIRPRRKRITGARTTSSSAALPASRPQLRGEIGTVLPFCSGPGQRPPGATNFSAGARTTWLMLMATPGTNVGTWPLTLLWLVRAVLPWSVAAGPSREPEALLRAKAPAAPGPAPGTALRPRAAATPRP